MNHHIGAAMWIIAAFLGFVVWWPIGVAFLAAITITAISQQLTGYRPPQQLSPHQPHYDGEVTVIEQRSQMKQVNQVKRPAITDRSRR